MASLRIELDRIDDAIHDLLMQRAEVVDRVVRARAKGSVALRAGREAAIIRRLVGRHSGRLPLRAVARIWRELLAATTAMQGQYVIAVGEPGAPEAAGDVLAVGRDRDFVHLAREHFGALTPLRVHPSAAQAIAEVSSGAVTAAVLPMPDPDRPDAAGWWTALMHHDDPRLHVVARLPFWSSRTEGAPQDQGLVVAAVAPDPSGSDRALIGLHHHAEMSHARLIALVADAGFLHPQILVWREPAGSASLVLIDVEGLVADDDLRLATVRRALGGAAPSVLGGYAVPVEGGTR